jgi:hypothetical protein
MSFITSPGVIVPPLTAGGVAYGTGGQAKVNSAGTANQALLSAGAGVPTWGVPTGAVSAPYTAGAVAYGTGTGLTLNAAGTSGQLLYSAGAGIPVWAAPPVSGMNLVATYDATSASSVDIENAFSTYDHYVIKGSNISTAASNQLYLQTKVGGSYTSQSYVSFDAKGDSGYVVWQVYNITSTTESQIALSGDNFNFTLYACNLNNQNGAKVKPMTGQIVGTSGTHVFYARGDSTAAVTGIRIFPSYGTFDKGKFYLYGLAKS